MGAKLKFLRGFVLIIICGFGFNLQAAKPELLKDIELGDQGSDPRDFTVIGGTTYFSVQDDFSLAVLNGRSSLWKTDGTEAGTVLVKKINPHIETSGHNTRHFIENFIVLNDTLYFTATDAICAQLTGCTGLSSQLWRSDGTPEGTVLVSHFGSRVSVREVVADEDVLYFSTRSFVELTLKGTNSVWKSDGTTNGTKRIKQFDSDLVFVGEMEVVGNTLYFPLYFDKIANASIWKSELWKSDGTLSGTQFIKGYSGFIDSLKSFKNNLLYFVGDSPNASNNLKLWKSDGTQLGTKLLKDFAMGSSVNTFTEAFSAQVNSTAGIVLYFRVQNTADTSLWKTDGSQSGTARVRSFANRSIRNMTTVGNRVYLAVFDSDSFSEELWRSNGTSASLVFVKKFAEIKNMLAFNEKLYFGADNGTDGAELWESNGSVNGTYMVEDINPGSGGSMPYISSVIIPWIATADTLFFGAYDGRHGVELWKLDKRNLALSGVLFLLLHDSE